MTSLDYGSLRHGGPFLGVTTREEGGALWWCTLPPYPYEIRGDAVLGGAWNDGCHGIPFRPGMIDGNAHATKTWHMQRNCHTSVTLVARITGSP